MDLNSILCPMSRSVCNTALMDVQRNAKFGHALFSPPSLIDLIKENDWDSFVAHLALHSNPSECDLKDPNDKST